MSNFIREDERFVIEALCGSLGGTWRSGEDPPDVYLKIGSAEIAVEISTLTQHVQGKNGEPEPRLSQDSGVLKLCNELNEELQSYIRPEEYIILTLHAPIDKLRKFKNKLKINLIGVLSNKKTGISELKVGKKNIKAHIVNGSRPSGGKVVGIVANENSTSHITSNAAFILNDRISKKTSKCSKVSHRPLWLALFNDYWLADPDTYLNVIKYYPKSHPFEKIFIVTSNKQVHLIHET